MSNRSNITGSVCKIATDFETYVVSATLEQITLAFGYDFMFFARQKFLRKKNVYC